MESQESTIAGVKPHAVCVPAPAQGHINSMMKLAKLLHHKGFHITFVHSKLSHKRILKSGGAAALDGLPDFRFEFIPDGFMAADEDTNPDVPTLAASAQSQLFNHFRNLVAEINNPISGVPPVTCIIADSFASYTLPVAAELKVPDVFFCSISACSYMGFLQYKELIKRGLWPLKSEEDLSNGYLEKSTIDWIPGMKNISMKDLPSFVRTTDPNDFMFNFVSYEAQKANDATAILINTFDELEHDVLEAMSAMLPPPVYTVGPLSAFCSRFPASPDACISSSLWKEDLSCLDWLEKRKIGSVVYANFGSVTVMSEEQLMEFAWGLASSGCDFLWSMRPDLVKGGGGGGDVIPAEYWAGIEGRGMIVSWCPQEEVLQHASVGVYLTHGGWNSTTESMTAGVPMICWPFMGDQQTNCRYVCKEWGVGAEIAGEVKREEVEVAIREVMEGERGRGMRRKALEWKVCVERATSPGGSSFVNFDRFIQEVLIQKT